MAEYLSPSDFVPQPLDRMSEYKFCPHCETRGEPTNRYLYRCKNNECGRYF